MLRAFFIFYKKISKKIKITLDNTSIRWQIYIGGGFTSVILKKSKHNRSVIKLYKT